MKELGYSKKVITTPHVMSDYYKNTPDIINRGCDELRETLVKEGIDIDIECAAEYYLDAELASKIKKKELLTFGDNYVLFELPFIGEPAKLCQCRSYLKCSWLVIPTGAGASRAICFLASSISRKVSGCCRQRRAAAVEYELLDRPLLTSR